MKTIQNPADRVALLQRLELLSEHSQRRWGTMSVEEMLWHLRQQLDLALGIAQTKQTARFPMNWLPIRWLAIYPMPWGKGSTTPDAMNVRRLNPPVQGFAQEQEQFLRRFQDVLQAKRFAPHPLFGKLSTKDWYRLIWKHIDHHLQQFGL